MISQIIGQSHQGRDLILHRFNSGGPPQVLFIGGVHGDEPEGVDLAQSILERSSSSSRGFDLITCLNPDGLMLKTRTNFNGVDLNRNFPSQDWSLSVSPSRYFSGTKPGSEPEVAALLQILSRQKYKYLVHFHSFTPSITFTGNPAAPLASQIAQLVGYPVQDDIGYPTPGSLGQYGWLDLATPVICFEIQEGLPTPQIESLFIPAVELLLSEIGQAHL